MISYLGCFRPNQRHNITITMAVTQTLTYGFSWFCWNCRFVSSFLLIGVKIEENIFNEAKSSNFNVLEGTVAQKKQAYYISFVEYYFPMGVRKSAATIKFELENRKL